MSKLNKYAPDGRKYSRSGPYRTESQSTYIVLGYEHPVGSFLNYAEERVRPFNRGIKKANRLAEARGLKFSKAQFYS